MRIVKRPPPVVCGGAVRVEVTPDRSERPRDSAAVIGAPEGCFPGLPPEEQARNARDTRRAEPRPASAR